jgi:hypothetical protein
LIDNSLREEFLQSVSNFSITDADQGVKTYRKTGKKSLKNEGKQRKMNNIEI